MDTMSPINSFLILLTAFVGVFAQSAVGGMFGVQLDLLPALMVYATLTAGTPTTAALALCGGLWFDSLSANPLGISVLPLAGIGYVISLRRDLILRDQAFAQFVIGMLASFSAPTLTLLFMLTAGMNPLIGWGTVWQLAVMTLAGGVATPVLFQFFGALTQTFGYREITSTSFRPDREIRRGRN
jgi:rod shape-determining protein MreD